MIRTTLIATISTIITTTASPIEIIKTTTDFSQNQITNNKAPKIGWQLTSTTKGDKQTAYQIVITENTPAGRESWNSGKVVSESSQMIPYGGRPLQPEKNYFLKAKVWDAKGKESKWSTPQKIRITPDIENQGAKWIGAITKADARLPEGRNHHAPSTKEDSIKKLWAAVDPQGKQSIILRRDFTTDKQVAEAYVYICGLGHYELTVNGKKVGDSQFTPLWSDYDKTLYYNAYQIDTLITKGQNTFGVMLGNGMFNAASGEGRYRKLRVSFGAPTLYFVARIKYTDGSTNTIVSDQYWRFHNSPITFNCIFGGEDYDARAEQQGWDRAGFDASGWKEVVVQPAPKGKLSFQTADDVKIMQRYDVKEVTRPDDTTLVFNMGQNLSGFPTIKVKGKRGDVIKLVVGENTNKDGYADQRRTGGPHYYQYTLKGDGVEQWQPRFSYYGYQYIMVSNANYKEHTTGAENPEILDIKSNFVYSSVPETGTFESSNEIFNKTHLLINNAIKSNMHGVFTDCPHREKLGWIEEIYLNGAGLFYNYDLTRLMPKVVQDMADAQHAGGLIPSVCPEYVDFGAESWGADFQDSPEWGAAFAVVPWMYYQYYGDSSLIVRNYDAMKRYVDYLGTKADGYILSHGLGDWYDYGEHSAGYSKNSPIAVAATSHWYLSVEKVTEAAVMLKNGLDADYYAALGDSIRRAYNAAFFDRVTGQYGTGSQFCNAVSLYMGLVEDGYRDLVLRNLLADIAAHDGKLTTGDIGNRYLFMVLADNGYNDVMYRMHNHYDAPGYGYQLKYGLTTLTEQWDPLKGNSWNHFMMGQIEEWFYVSLAGLRFDVDFFGFKGVVFAPVPVDGLDYVRGCYSSVYGVVSGLLRRVDGGYCYDIEIPVNSFGRFVVPDGGKNVMLDGRPYYGGGIGSGKYRITWE